MPWFRMDIHWYQEEKVQEAAEAAGGVVFSVFPVLIAKAKAQANGGKVEFTYRLFATELFSTEAEIEQAIDALVSARVLTRPQASAKAATVAFDKRTWRRWQESARKAEGREVEQTA